MKKINLFISIVLLWQFSSGQNLSNQFKKEIVYTHDTIQFDTLSIVPGSFSIFQNNKKITEDVYKIDYPKAILIFTKSDTSYTNPTFDTITVYYRRFPLNFTKSYAHKTEGIKSDSLTGRVNQRYSPADKETNFFNDSRLSKSGSISRGINFGNNQNASLSSDFNLQLSGNINQDISVNANISDSNIPVQTDGTTQNLREFDNVYIELKSKKSKLIVGDFVMAKPYGYFMNFNKKVQGAGFSTNLNNNKRVNVYSSINTAVSKGKYNRQKILAAEGNQGPYKLSGANNELFIIILSGSEKVFINGKLLTRGNENDYVIDYNTGELTFTAKMPITKDSRIIVEFEYSELSYARFAFSSENVIKTKNSVHFINIFSEHDAKNQNLRQELNEDQKLLLSSVGDNVNSAFVENSLLLSKYNNEEIVYRKTDTTINNTLYSGIFVHTTDSTASVYRLGFAYVGENNGNYIRIRSESNGKVYQWTPPVNNVPQGNYEPIRLLISPKKKQMISFGGTNHFVNSGSELSYEFSISNNDKNTFSQADDDNNAGYAVKLGFTKDFLKQDTSTTFLRLGTDLIFTDSNFDALETYKDPEFERDWNLKPGYDQGNEFFTDLYLNYYKKNFINAHIETGVLKQDNQYTGNKSIATITLNKKNYSANLNFNYLNSNDSTYSSEFIRYNAKIERHFPFLIFGVSDMGEKNLIQNKMNDSVSNFSFRFNQWETYIKTPSKKNRSFMLSYINREDFLPKNEKLNYVSYAQDLKLSGKLFNSKNHKLNTDISYRRLNVSDSTLSQNNSEETLAGRIQHSLNLFKGSIHTTSFIEHITGNELIREFSYIEVQPGQGNFTWKDFNSNEIKELNEFVKANFQDEANYIRIFLPSNEYKKVYNQNFYQTVNLIPRRVWQKESGVKKVLSVFSNRFSYKHNRKLNHSAEFYKLNIPDSLFQALNSAIKNILLLDIRKTQTKLSYTYLSNQNKLLLLNGFDKRTNTYQGFNFIQNINQFKFSNSFIKGSKTYNSQFFTNSNYNIIYTENHSSLTYQFLKRNDITGSFNYKKKNNSIGEEMYNSYSVGGEYKYKSDKQGSISLKFDYISITFEGTENTSVAYELLEGLTDGKNYIWSLSWFKNLSDFLRLELNYFGRKAGDNKTIHSGGLSIRAIF